MECCHNDGDHANNAAVNLRWDTRKSNIHDQIKHGVFARGQAMANAKLKPDSVLAIRKERSELGIRYKELARKYGVSENQIYLVVKRKAWRHI
jgi:ribosome-binding protein aMBF1 (putative translation factor)